MNAPGLCGVLSMALWEAVLAYHVSSENDNGAEELSPFRPAITKRRYA